MLQKQNPESKIFVFKHKSSFNLQQSTNTNKTKFAGVDPLKDVERLGKKLGFTFDNKKFHNVSLGQGQEIVAESALDVAAEDGHWVVLQVERFKNRA